MIGSTDHAEAPWVAWLQDKLAWQHNLEMMGTQQQNSASLQFLEAGPVLFSLGSRYAVMLACDTKECEKVEVSYVRMEGEFHLPSLLRLVNS